MRRRVQFEAGLSLGDRAQLATARSAPVADDSKGARLFGIEGTCVSLIISDRGF